MNSPEHIILEKAKAGTLEVEHLLRLAHIGDDATADFLKEFRGEGNKGHLEELKIGADSFRIWALVVEEYLRGGAENLKKLANKGYARFVIALLENLHSEESLSIMVDIFSSIIRNPRESKELSGRLVSAINIILSFPPVVEVDGKVEADLREFIHRYIDMAESDQEYATAICALRSIGDESSIKLIKSKKKLSGSWSGTEKIVINKINSKTTKVNKKGIKS